MTTDPVAICSSSTLRCTPSRGRGQCLSMYSRRDWETGRAGTNGDRLTRGCARKRRSSNCSDGRSCAACAFLPLFPDPEDGGQQCCLLTGDLASDWALILQGAGLRSHATARWAYLFKMIACFLFLCLPCLPPQPPLVSLVRF